MSPNNTRQPGRALKLLALDPGKSFGWALSNTLEPESTLEIAGYWLPNYPAHIGDVACVCGAWDLSAIKDRGHRFNQLSQLIESVKDLDAIIYEVAPGLRGHASKWHLGYLSTAERICYANSIPLYTVNASTWKKYSLRNARPPEGKAKSKSEAQARFGLDPAAIDDASDALHILCWGLQLTAVTRAVD